MKSAADIIQSIQNKPQFSKLSAYGCINLVKRSFSAPLQRMIKFAYIKNGTLFFVLNHPGAKQEFDNSIDSIKSALKFAKPKECQGIPFSDIKSFVSHSAGKKSETLVLTNPSQSFYKERSKGNFKIHTKDEKLTSLFKEIQEIVKRQYESAPEH